MPSPAAYHPPRPTATAATVLLAVTGAATVFSLIAGIRLHGAAGDLPADVTLATSDSTAFTDAQALYRHASQIHLVALLASTVTFILWFYRVRVNAERFDPHGHRLKRGWTIGAWFTPVAALWLPQQIAADTWRASTRPDESGVRPALAPALLKLWWATLWATIVVNRLGAQFYGQAHYPDTYQEAIGWLTASDLLELAAAVLAILVVRKLTALQEQRATESVTRAYGTPAQTTRNS
ncbi:DUF4328 domain-containing protein [Kitasatospora sp. NPDC101447]|uniref:DUF4328 domain-containing protein n=1 Tax=Kitasatospora sp. NPDC101447 TaxID=3364102 RepID=UPI0037F4FCAB